MGKQNTQTDGMQTPTLGWVGRRRVMQRRTVLLALGVLLLVGLFIGVAAYHFTHQLKFPEPNMTTEEKYHYLADQGNYRGAESVLAGGLANAKTNDDKVAIYFQQTSVALQFKNYKDAQKYADKAVATDSSSSNTYELLATVAEAQGNKKAAKSYLQQAISHLDKNLPQYNLMLLQYQSEIKGLGV